MQPSRRIIVYAIAATFGVIAGCNGGGNGGGEPDSAPISPSCMEATMRSDLEWIEDNVFQPSCAAFSVCHQGSAIAAEGLNLEPGMAEVNLVGVESKIVARLGHGPMHLVEPGDPDQSYLIVIMRGEPDELIDRSSGRMPLGNPPLCDEKIDAVARWISSL